MGDRSIDISIIITCFNEENNIGDCLKSLVDQDYDLGKYEIIVSDGGSTDNTQHIINDCIEKYSNIHLVIETKKGTASGRNAGIKASKYEYIAFIDADCEAPPNWLNVLVSSYKTAYSEDPSIIAVGGANFPPDDANSFLKAIGVSLDSFMGSFNSAQGRLFKNLRYVSSLANLNVLYKKDAIAGAGYFDESLFSEAEDADMNYRLSSAGNKFMFIPESFVYHKMRPTPMSWFRNMFRYGKGRARLLKRHPDMWNITYTLPLLFSVGIISIILVPVSNIFLLPMLYFPMLLVFSVYQSHKKRSPSLFLQVMTVYLIQHFGYAAGEIYGLLHPRIK